jgi:hypothetical protein
MDGELRHQLRFVRRLPHAPEKVWRAITERSSLEQWFPLEGGEPETLVSEPPRLLELDFGGDILRFEIEPSEEGCVLTFTDTFGELGKAARDAAGWHVCIERLEAHLRGEEVQWETRERWSEVHPGYVEALGPEAATIGPPPGH